MADRPHLWAIANLMVGRYGARANLQAEANRAAADRAGDDEVRAIWNGVAGVLASSSGSRQGMTALDA